MNICGEAGIFSLIGAVSTARPISIQVAGNLQARCSANGTAIAQLKRYRKKIGHMG